MLLMQLLFVRLVLAKLNDMKYINLGIVFLVIQRIA